MTALVETLRSWSGRIDRRDPGWIAVIPLMLVALALRMPRLLATPSLWAEDGDRFIRGFTEGGWRSLVQAVHGAGYHVFFERLAAGLLALVPLRYAEWLFHLVSLGAILFAAAVTWLCLPTRSVLLRAIACLAIVVVPVSPTTMYLTLVNTQWILAPATMLLIVTNFVPTARHKGAWCAALFVLCLTGPFAVLAAPVVLWRMVHYRDLKREKLFYGTLFAGIAIQVATLVVFLGTRPKLGTSFWIVGWYRAVVENMGLRIFPSFLMLGLFVAFVAWLAWRVLQDDDRERRFTIAALLALSALNFLAGYYSYRHIPEHTGPFMNGERYFFVPFLLLIYFLLTAARGLWVPVAVFFVGFACLRNVAPIEGGLEGRSPNYWRSHVEASRYEASTPIITRPIWLIHNEWRYDIANPAPQAAPLQRPLGLQDLELSGMSASSPAPGVIKLERNALTPDLFGGSLSRLPQTGTRPAADATDGVWKGNGVNVAPGADGAVRITLLTPDNALFQTISGVEKGKIVTFAFEARADKAMTLRPHLTDYKAGFWYGAELTPEWKPFVFYFAVNPGIFRVGLYLTLNTALPATFEVRNVHAMLDEPTHMVARVPVECAAYRDLEISYSGVGGIGIHRLDASATRGAYDDWYALHRFAYWPGVREFVFALPNRGVNWLRLSLLPAGELRNLTLKCF